MLISASDIIQANFNSRKFTSDEELALDGIIAGVIKAIERYLDRPLEVATYTQYANTEDYVFIPIVQPVISTDADTERFNNSRIVLKEADSKVTYEAGYTSENLPPDIRQAVYNLTMFELNKAERNDYGLSSKTVNTGSTNASIQVEQRNYYQSVLDRLEAYKNMQKYGWIE